MTDVNGGQRCSQDNVVLSMLLVWTDTMTGFFRFVRSAT